MPTLAGCTKGEHCEYNWEVEVFDTHGEAKEAQINHEHHAWRRDVAWEDVPEEAYREAEK